MAQNDKNFCPSHSVSQEVYLISLWFLVHMCEMVFPACFFFFHFFEILIFFLFLFLGDKRAENDPKLPI